MPLSVSGRGGIHAWAPASAPCLPPAPTTTTVPGRVHPLLPATPALPPTRAAPSTAPTAPPVAPLPLPSDLARMFDEPTGPGAAPAVPLAGLLAPTASSSSWLGRLVSSAPRAPVMAVAGPAGTPAGVLWAGLADRWQGKAKRANSSSASATSSAYSCYSSFSSDDSGPEPGNTATHTLPLTRAAPFAAPPTTAPTAPPVAPLPLPSDLAQMFDEPIGLSAAPTAPVATSVAPTASSSSWLLDDIEVSDTPYVTVNVRTKYLLTLTCVPVYLTQSRWHSRRRCSRWISARQQSRR